MGIVMWKAEFQKTYAGVSAEAIWSAWTDVNNWARWDLGLEHARMTVPFDVGSTFVLKPKGGPTVNIEIVESVPRVRFTDVTRFPLARMYDSHELEQTAAGLTIKSRIHVEGPLGWLWKRLVAADVASGVPAQTDALVEYVRGLP